MDETGTTADRSASGLVARHSTLAFVGLTLCLSWGWWFGVASLVGGEVPELLVLPGGFGPAVAAIAVARASGDLDALFARLRRARTARRWYLLALVLPPAAMGIAVLGYAAVGGPLAPERLPGAVLGYPLAVVALALVGGGQEEIGWRGYALPTLQATYGPLAASAVLGVVWAVWHAPLFLLGNAPSASGAFGLYLPLVVAFSVVFTWAFNRTGGSVPLLMLLHGGVNAAGSVVPIPPGAVGAWGIHLDASIAAAFALVAVAVVAVAGTGLGYGDASDDGTTGDGAAAPAPGGD